LSMRRGALRTRNKKFSGLMNTSPISKNRHVLVLGGAGYVGNVLIPYLLDRGYSVTCADLLLYENGPLMVPYLSHPAFRFVQADCRDWASYDDMMQGVTDVIILAALVGDPITKVYPKESTEINVTGLKNFLQYCANQSLARVVFVSTCSNYGMRADDSLATEESALNPLSVYSKNKVEIEQYLMSEGSQLPFTILRFATAFGLSPRMRFDLTVSEFTRELALGRDLLVYDADTWRPYCHVLDMSRAMELVLQATEDLVCGEVFNTGGDMNNHTKRSIVEVVQQHLPEAQVRYQNHGSDPRNYRVDFSKIKKTLGFEPVFSVEQGVEELLTALESGIFYDADRRPNYFGNRKISLFDGPMVESS